MNTIDTPPVIGAPALLAVDAALPAYAGVLSRAAALLVDGIVVLPFILAAGWVHHLSWAGNILLLPLLFALPLGYIIFCHARWGQTVGKMAAGIQVRQLSGARLTAREAWLRSSVDLLFALVVATAFLAPIVAAGPNGFNSLSHLERDELENSSFVKESAVHAAQGIWYLCELLVLLGSTRRRAIHDFIAGTVVVRLDDPRSQRMQKRLLWPCALAIVALMLVPIILPNILASREVAATNAIVNNLRIIDGAKEQWALENNKSIGAVPGHEALGRYMKGGVFPQSIAGEVYIINPIGAPPAAQFNGREITLDPGKNQFLGSGLQNQER